MAATVLAQPMPRSTSPTQLDTARSPSSASFDTARPASEHHSRSSSSAAHSGGGHERADSVGSIGINPLHAISHPASGKQPQEVHIVKVTGNSVQVEPGPPSDTFSQRIGKSIARVIPLLDGLRYDDTVGPPPPSPPASEEQGLDEGPSTSTVAPRMSLTKSEPISCEDDVFYGLGHGRRQSVSSSLELPVPPPKMKNARSEPAVTFEEPTPTSTLSRPGPSMHLLHRSSTDTKASLISATRPSNSDDDKSSPSKSRAAALHLSADGYLQPPSPTPYKRPTRRNTTGSTEPDSPRARAFRKVTAGTGTAPSSYGSGPWLEDMDADGELATDIQLQAEQIRRERQTKREMAQKEAEAALTRSMSSARGVGGARDEEKQVLVGNLIGEDHVNYVLMYNMLTGIRIAVSRCQAKIKRPLTDDDFVARHKYSFDILGNELTPAAKYDFKFKDYAPWVFRELRENYFHLDPSDYLVSLTAKYILSELGSPGKSGSFFYFSRDYRFIIKTIHHSEHKFLRSILKQYYEHVKSNPHTLLSRFYGLHRVKLPRGKKIHFVIMNNLFPPHKDVHETYDLKGSTVGREYPEEKASKNPRAVLKDVNWINRGKQLELGPEKRALLTEQIRRDSELLKVLHVMDYSLLVGIHNMRRGNRDNVRRNTLKVFSPNMPRMKRKLTQLKSSSPEAIAIRKAMRESDPKRLDAPGGESLPERDTGDRQHFIFYQDEGGLRATNQTNEDLDTIYYLGIIDILTPYNTKKHLEHFWKGLHSDRHKISPVPPPEYAERFFAFMKAIMPGGGGGERFKPEK